MSRREIKHALLHQAAFMPELGDLTRTLPPQGRSLNMKLYATPEGVEIEVPRDSTTVVGVVPWANVVTATFSGAAPKTVAVKPKA